MTGYLDITAPYKKSAIALQDQVAAEAYKKMYKMYANLPQAEQNANSSDLAATKRLYHNQGRGALKSIVQMQQVFRALAVPPPPPVEPRLPRYPSPAYRRHLTPSTSTIESDVESDGDGNESDGVASYFSPSRWLTRLRKR